MHPGPKYVYEKLVRAGLLMLVDWDTEGSWNSGPLDTDDLGHRSGWILRLS